MKAVIVDIEGKTAVGLNKAGDFIKIKNNEKYQVGLEIEVPSNASMNFKKLSRIMPIAAAFLVFISLGAGAYAYTVPYSYVDVDINPSIEITSNIFDRIIKVESLNDDGKKLITDNSLKNKDINDGINDILKVAVDDGYIVSSTTSAVMFTVSGKDDSKVAKMETVIQKNVDEKFKSTGTTADVIVENVTLKGHDDAKVQGISPGKLLLIQRLMKDDPDVKISDYKNAPVKEILTELKNAKQKNNFNTKDAVNSSQKNNKWNNEQNNKAGSTTGSNISINVQNKDKNSKDVIPTDNEAVRQKNWEFERRQSIKNRLNNNSENNRFKNNDKASNADNQKKETTVKKNEQKNNKTIENKKKQTKKTDLKDSKKTRDKTNSKNSKQAGSSAQDDQGDQNEQN